jgi:triacylglycerol lipase
MSGLRIVSVLCACLLVLSACQTFSPLSVVQSESALHQQSSASPTLTRFLENQYQHVFQEHDLNRNGFLEAEELSFAPETFSRLDRNRDQRLSFDEARPKADFLRHQARWLGNALKNAFEQQARETTALDLPAATSYAAFEQAFLTETETMRTASTATQAPRERIPVLLVPGYAEPSWYFMYGIYRDLKKAGWPVEGINLFPNFASAEEQAAKVKAKVAAMLKKYRVSRVNLVVHSFGGLISRYYIQALGGEQAVKHLVTVATPHFGTYVSYLGPGDSADQMNPGSSFIQNLNAQGFTRPPVIYTSLWTPVDEIVIPPKYSIMPDSTVYEVPWTGHLTILFSSRSYQYIRQTLQRG